MTAEEILTKAADVVEFSGRWVNHAPISREQTCASFALAEVARRRGRHAAMTGAERQARTALELEIGSPIITHWNDAQTDAVVVASTLRAAKRWLA